LQRIRELAENAIAGSEGDFAEIRILRSRRSFVGQAGMETTNYGPVGSFTGTARVFISNRWGSCEFTSPDQMRLALDRAAAHAIHSNSEPVPFPMLSSECRDTYTDDTGKIPLGEVSLREKAFLCRHYCELLAATTRQGSASVVYNQLQKEKLVVNSIGTSIVEYENLGSLRMQAVLPGGASCRSEIAARGGFEPFRGLERQIEEQGRKLLVRETSTAIAPGVSRIILDPELTGVLVHEAFGHLVEADFLESNPAVAHMLRPGTTVGSEHVSIVDDTTLLEMPGGMKWDDEGTPGRRTQLIRNGSVAGWLHTSGTAARSGTEPTGNSRAADPGGFPEARMTCTYMEPGKLSMEGLLARMDCGLYLKGFMGGATDMDRFSIAAQEVWTVRNGVIEKPVAPVVVSGRVTDVLTSVEGAADDLVLTGRLEGCSRMGGRALPVSYGGPHILIGRIQVN
jgi:TldD protein